jgi:hypothetical protein
MIRTINEHHRVAKHLFALAKQRPAHRLRLLQFARLHLSLARLQLENPALRPNRRRSAHTLAGVASEGAELCRGRRVSDAQVVRFPGRL